MGDFETRLEIAKQLVKELPAQEPPNWEEMEISRPKTFGKEQIAKELQNPALVDVLNDILEGKFPTSSMAERERSNYTLSQHYDAVSLVKRLGIKLPKPEKSILG